VIGVGVVTGLTFIAISILFISWAVLLMVALSSENENNNE
jgi:hypothetical protein